LKKIDPPQKGGKLQMQGNVRVGRTKYQGGKVILPSYPEYTTVTVMTPRFGKYHKLGPYSLRNDEGQILENVWQFSKVYPKVPKVNIPYSSGDRRIVWQWPEEVHLDDEGNPNRQYWQWRNTGMNNSEPVRNPVGWKYLKTCQYALKEPHGPKLDYIESRKAIYLPNYLQEVMKEPLFLELKQRLLNGENLVIAEIDGPHQESLGYYREKYNVAENFIEQDTIYLTQESVGILLNDPKHPFGHGYCLGMALLGE
jgi:hypothetical protein